MSGWVVARNQRVEVGCEIVHFLSETLSPHRYSAGATLGRSPVLGRAIGELPPRRDIDGELVGVVPPVVLGVELSQHACAGVVKTIDPGFTCVASQ